MRTAIVPFEYERLRDIYTLQVGGELMRPLVEAIRAGMVQCGDVLMAFTVKEGDGTERPIEDYINFDSTEDTPDASR